MTCVNVNITHYPPSVVVFFLIPEEASLRYLRLRKPPHRHPFTVGSVPLSSMVMYYYLKSVQTHPLSTRSAHHQPFLCPFCRTEKVMLLIDLFVRPIEQSVSTVCGLPIVHRSYSAPLCVVDPPSVLVLPHLTTSNRPAACTFILQRRC
jgi:hypothetical protein